MNNDDKSGFFGPPSRSNSPAPGKALDYNRYMQHGATRSGDIEMTRLGGTDQVPLLTSQQYPGYFDPMASATTLTSQYQTPVMENAPGIPPPLPAQDYREAPIHRQYQQYNPAASQPPPRSMSTSPGPHYMGGYETNFAGRGAHRA